MAARTSLEGHAVVNYWLFKTEPDEYSIDDLAREKQCRWEGIRNYQARNRLRDEVSVGDSVFIYHSSCAVPAVVGIATIIRAAYPDPCQFDSNSPYFDAKSTHEAPRWLCVDIRYQQHLPHAVSLKKIRQVTSLSNMELVTRARLSIQKVSRADADTLIDLAGA